MSEKNLPAFVALSDLEDFQREHGLRWVWCKWVRGVLTGGFVSVKGEKKEREKLAAIRPKAVWSFEEVKDAK